MLYWRGTEAAWFVVEEGEAQRIVEKLNLEWGFDDYISDLPVDRDLALGYHQGSSPQGDMTLSLRVDPELCIRALAKKRDHLSDKGTWLRFDEEMWRFRRALEPLLPIINRDTMPQIDEVCTD